LAGRSACMGCAAPHADALPRALRATWITWGRMAAADTSSRNQPAAGGRLLRVGRHEVDLDRRLVALAGTQDTRRLTLKAMQVLLALAEAGGRVVSREQLLGRVWPDTLPTDDVLTQAVAQLR